MDELTTPFMRKSHISKYGN